MLSAYFSLWSTRALCGTLEGHVRSTGACGAGGFPLLEFHAVRRGAIFPGCGARDAIRRRGLASLRNYTTTSRPWTGRVGTVPPSFSSFYLLDMLQIALIASVWSHSVISALAFATHCCLRSHTEECT